MAFSWDFNDVAHFSRAFRQRFGQSPRGFRPAQPTAHGEDVAGTDQMEVGWIPGTP
jgi:AraC-like DNA-binding protein